MKINLDDYREANVRVLSGREKGRTLRKQLKLGNYDKEGINIEVIVPDDIYSLNASFFLGLFQPEYSR